MFSIFFNAKTLVLPPAMYFFKLFFSISCWIYAAAVFFCSSFFFACMLNKKSLHKFPSVDVLNERNEKSLWPNDSDSRFKKERFSPKFYFHAWWVFYYGIMSILVLAYCCKVIYSTSYRSFCVPSSIIMWYKRDNFFPLYFWQLFLLIFVVGRFKKFHPMLK